MFPVLFSLLMVLSRGSDSRRQNTSPREMSEGSGGNGPQCLNRRSLVGVFFSMNEGLSWRTWINHGECLGWWFLARFGSNSVSCDWVTCVWHRQPAGHPQVNAYHHLPLFSLSPLLLSSCLPSFLNTWQKVTGNIGQLEAVKLNLEDSMVCVEDQKKIVQEKKKQLEKDNSTPSNKKQTNWQMESPRLSSSTKSTWATTIQGSYLFCTWPGRRISPTILKGRICQITARDLDAPLQCLGMEIDSLKEDEEWVEKRWWSVGLMEEHGSRNVHEKKLNENNGRDETVVWWVELVILHMVLLMYRKNCRGATDSIHCRVWCHDMFSEVRVFRNSGRWSAKCSTTMVWSMSLWWCIGFFPPKKVKPESLRKLCEEPDCMCSENGVVWAQAPIIVVSSPLPSFLSYFFFVTPLLKKYPFPLFRFFPPFPWKILLMFYFSLLKMFCPWLLQCDKIMQFSSWRDLPFSLDFLKVRFVSLLSFIFSRTLPY